MLEETDGAGKEFRLGTTVEVEGKEYSRPEDRLEKTLRSYPALQ